MRLQIEKGVYGGSGLAHTPAGQAVFVPYTLPGEIVEAEPAASTRGAPEGKLLQVMRASADRVDPLCQHFGVCGGCQYQHAAYPAQLGMKRAILAETLERAGLRDLPSIELHAGEPWGYRNRIRLRIQGGGPGANASQAIEFGYNLRDSNQLLPIAECPIAAPVLWRAAEAFQALAAEDAGATGWLGAAAEIELSCTNDQSRVQMLLLLRDIRSEGFQALCESLRARLPELAGAGAVLEEGRGRRSPVPAATWGADGLPMQVAGRSYWVSRGGFFQVNRTLAEALVSLVTDGRSGELAWDLFSGAGLFARPLAAKFRQVTAVEASATAAGDLQRAKIASISVRAQPVLGFLRQAAIERDRPELVVLDPPRAGLGLAGARLLTGIAPRQIVYISCDPATLGRDLRAMVDSGYNLAELHLVDLFPQTFHLETVAVLHRA